MKKILMIAVCVTASGFLFAQTVQFGLKGGVNVASVHSDNNTDYNSVTSFHAGGLAHIHVSPHLAVQPELFYSGEGAEFGGSKVKFGYLNLPVLAQYMIGNGFRLQTGPQIGFLLSAKQKSGESETDIKDNYKGVDFGWAIGASYLFPGTGVGIDARYTLGITDIYDAGPTKVQNRVFGLGLFYQFKH
ncbi:MAG TPA: porin family protein [Chitinophagaceae bacterium]|nr:porin family protein [Chitinophagaceae bacterium]